MKKEYFFIAYSYEGEQRLESIVTKMNPAKWLRERNAGIIHERNMAIEVEEKQELELKRKKLELKRKYENMTFLQRLKCAHTKEGMECEITSAYPWLQMTRVANPLIKIINWKEISEAEFEMFSETINSGMEQL